MTKGINRNGFEDPKGVFPTSDYYNIAGTNKAARGLERNDLYVGGGHRNVDLKLSKQNPSQYPHNQVQKTAAGHSIELDDTPGSERLLLKHTSGTGIEMRNDGSILISSRKNTVRLGGADDKVVIEGDGEIVYGGNLSLTVAGDMALKVGGSLQIATKANRIDTVDGNYSLNVNKNVQESITGDKTQLVNNITDIINGDLNRAVKGSNNIQAQNTSLLNADSCLITTRGSLTMTGLNTNLNGSRTVILGDSGTIGGANITGYVKNIFGTSGTFTAGFTAPTFHGDLIGDVQGVATGAIDANRSFSAGPGGQSQSITNAATDTAQTVQPTSAIIKDLIDNSSVGRRQVITDPGGDLRNKVDQTANQSIDRKKLNTDQVRSKMRDENNAANETFVGHQVSEGILSGGYATPLPTRVVRSAGKLPGVRTGVTSIGGAVDAQIKKFTHVPAIRRTILPDPNFNVDAQGSIDQFTKLGPGISLGRFTGGFGDAGSLEMLDQNRRLQVARNFSLQAELNRSVINNDGQFRDHRLVVVEGLYEKGPTETLKGGSLNDLASDGRVVVYELVGNDGKIDRSTSFDLAVFWKDNFDYDKIILDYDTFDPDGSLNTQIIVVMPNVPDTYRVSFKKDIETRFNNNIQSVNELVELV